MSRLVLFCVAMGVACALAPISRAQDITQYISSPNVNAGVPAINQFAQQHVANLTSDDASVRAAARDALRDPLRDPTIPSVAFRLAYYDALSDSLLEMIGSGNAAQAINAIYVMGDLGTTQAKDELIDKLASDNESIRYASATALRRTMEIINTGRSVISNTQSVVDDIRQAMERESSVLVVDALIRALDTIDNDNMVALRIAANIAICEGVVGHFRANGRDEDVYQCASTLLRAINVVRSMYFTEPGSIAQSNLGQEASVLCGHAMTVLSGYLDGRDLSDEGTRDSIATCLKASETLAGLVGDNMTQTPYPGSQNVADAVDDWLQGGGEGNVIDAVDTWIGPSGLLKRSPFNLNDADFAR
ncbi:MAG: HEAT repeat domain-containing protein [Planctomycetota bacterium]|jgi:hypothetical protein